MYLRQKKQQDGEQCVEDKECEQRGDIYDDDDEVNEGFNFEDDDEDDEQWEMEQEAEEANELYESKLDSVDEVLFVQEKLTTLETQNQAHYLTILGLISDENKNTLMQMFQQAKVLSD